MVEKNKEYIVDIIDNGFQGEGIAKIDDFTIFVPNAIKGERVRVLIVKVLTSYAFAKIIEFVQKSKNRVEADCLTYKRCGGCNLRHLKYEETLKIKQNSVQSLVNKTLKNKIKVEDVLGMENPYYYRNKVQFPVGIDKDGKMQMGVFASRTHNIIPVKDCFIQNKDAQMLAKFVFNYWKENNLSVYDEKTQKGLLRHIVVKVGIKTNEFMCVLVINGLGFSKEDDFVKTITNQFPKLTTIVINSNMENTNVILGKKNRNIFGNGYIEDILGEYKFKISPLSFYQVNPIQAEKLYEMAVKQAEISKDDVVFDLYCGIGTISIFMSKYAKKVYGVEIVEEAVQNAKENAKMNGISNVEFLSGDVENILNDLLNVRNIKPDVVLVDPPRKGLDLKSIGNLCEVLPKRIVYISCNPATLVRDLARLEDKYEVMGIRLVDMFPFTSHVECVALMGRKDNKSE